MIPNSDSPVTLLDGFKIFSPAHEIDRPLLSYPDLRKYQPKLFFKQSQIF